MNKINDDQFLTVHGWMRTRLKLSGNELWLYALIYSFNKATKKEFYGSNAYMREWLGVSHNTIREALKRLVARGLIFRRDAITDNGTRCYYMVELKPLGIRHIVQDVHFRAKTETNVQDLESPSQNLDTPASKIEEGVCQKLDTPSSETGANNNINNDIEKDIHNKPTLQAEAVTDSAVKEENNVCVDFNKILNEAYIKTGGNILASANYMYIDGLCKTLTESAYSTPLDEEIPF